MGLFKNLLKKFIDFKDSLKGNKTVIKALQEERPELAKKLIVKGRDIHKIDDLGNTALHYAAALGHYEIIQVLLEHGAKIYTENYDGQTPLFYAMEYHQIDAAKILWSYYHKLMLSQHLYNEDNELIIELCAIGVNCSWKYGEANSGFFQKSSITEKGHIIHTRAVEIGKILNHQGGLKGMLEAHNAVSKTIGNRAAIELSAVWHGVGDWLH